VCDRRNEVLAPARLSSEQDCGRRVVDRGHHEDIDTDASS